MRAVLYQVSTKGGKVIKVSYDYAAGQHDPGQAQVLSEMYRAALEAGIDLDDIDHETFERNEID